MDNWVEVNPAHLFRESDFVPLQDSVMKRFLKLIVPVNAPLVFFLRLPVHENHVHAKRFID